MFQIFFITIYFVFCSSLHAAQGTNNSKTPQSMEEMAEVLKAKKAALEPFDPKKVKIDISSVKLLELELETGFFSRSIVCRQCLSKLRA